MLGRAETALAKPGAAGDHGHRGLSGNPGPGVGHVHRRRLVARVHELQALVLHGVHQGEDGVPHYGEDPANPLLLEGPHQQVRPGELGHVRSLRRRLRLLELTRRSQGPQGRA